MHRLSFPLAVALAGVMSGACAQTVERPDRLGDTMRWALPLAAAAWSLHEDDREGLLQLGESWAAAELAAGALNRAIKSPRPSGTGRGFASGHAAGAFAVAGYLDRRYGFATAAPAYVLAVATAASRVDKRHHFTRQVLVGAGVGLASAHVFTRRLGERQSLGVAAAPGSWSLAYSAEF